MIFGAVGTLYGVSMADRTMNYIPTEATVVTADVDCYVKNSSGQLVDKTTEKRAYMDCEFAPLAAEMHGYSKSDIHKRTKFTYSFVSPVDGSKQKGQHETEYAQYDVGQKFTIYAHKEEAGRSRF